MPDHVWTDSIKPFGVTGDFGHGDVGFIKPSIGRGRGKEVWQGQAKEEQNHLFQGEPSYYFPLFVTISLTTVHGNEKIWPEWAQ